MHYALDCLRLCLAWCPIWRKHQQRQRQLSGAQGVVAALGRRRGHRCRGRGGSSGPCLAGIQQLDRRGEGPSQAGGEEPQRADRSGSAQLDSP